MRARHRTTESEKAPRWCRAKRRSLHRKDEQIAQSKVFLFEAGGLRRRRRPRMEGERDSLDKDLRSTAEKQQQSLSTFLAWSHPADG